MGLARADRPRDDDVLAAVKVAAAGKLGDLGRLDTLEGAPVELVERLGLREAGFTEETGNGALAPPLDLDVEQMDEEVLVAPAAVRRLADERRILTPQGGEAQLPAGLLDERVRGGLRYERPPAAGGRSRRLVPPRRRSPPAKRARGYAPAAWSRPPSARAGPSAASPAPS